MSKQVIRIDVFVSSPGDVTPEREAVLRVVEKLNRNPWINEDYFLKPRLYDYEVPPQLGASAQTIVDEYLQFLETYLMICIFWSRMGTPFTHEDTGEHFESGTQYELLKAYEHFQQHQQPLILLYRKTDENPNADPGQQERLKDFLENQLGNDKQLKGLWAYFQGTGEFEEKIEQHLYEVLTEKPPQPKKIETVEKPEFEEEPRRVDAAMPGACTLDEPTEVRVMVCLPDSEGLAAYLPEVADPLHPVSKKDVTKAPLSVAFPKDKDTGELKPAQVIIELSADDFTMDETRQTTSLSPKRDSGLISFRLMPHTARQASLVQVRVKTIGLDGSEIVCGSTSLYTHIQQAGLPGLAPAAETWNLAALPLGAPAPSEPSLRDMTTDVNLPPVYAPPPGSDKPKEEIMYLDTEEIPEESTKGTHPTPETPDDRDPDLLQTTIPRRSQSGPQPTNIAEFVQNGLRFQRKKEYGQALEAYQQALVLAKHEDSSSTAAGQVTNMIGSLYEMMGENLQAIEYYQQTLDIAQQDQDSTTEFNMLYRLGLLYHLQGDHPTARQFYRTALDHSRALPGSSNMAKVVYRLGILDHLEKAYPQALENYQQALAIAQKRQLYNIETHTLHQIGELYLDQEDYDPAKDHLLRSLKVSQRTGDRPAQQPTLHNLGRLCFKQTDYPQAEKYLRQALTIAEETQDQAAQAAAHYRLGRLRHQQGQLDEAKTHYTQASELGKTANPDLAHRAAERLLNLDS